MHGTAKVINARTLRSEKIGRQLLRPVTERPKFGSRLGNNGHTELPRNTKSRLPDEPPPAVLPFTTLWNLHSLFILIIWKQCAWYYLIKSTYMGFFFTWSQRIWSLFITVQFCVFRPVWLLLWIVSARLLAVLSVHIIATFKVTCNEKLLHVILKISWTF